jgi:HAD superfamily hydrolase (TIGR01509 family)
MTAAARLIRSANCVLLDFDGPVCSVFSSIPAPDVARRLRAELTGPLPPAVTEASDPFVVLRYAATQGRADDIDALLTSLEVRSVQAAKPTDGIAHLLSALATVGVPVCLVTNNSTAAARTFLDKHDLGRHVHTVVGRVPGRPDLLKPHPHLVRTAMARHGMWPGQCVLVGDSVSDVQAARNAGTRVIAYINKPHKRTRLHAAGPDATVASIADLTRSLSTLT